MARLQFNGLNPCHRKNLHAIKTTYSSSGNSLGWMNKIDLGRRKNTDALSPIFLLVNGRFLSFPIFVQYLWQTMQFCVGINLGLEKHVQKANDARTHQMH